LEDAGSDRLVGLGEALSFLPARSLSAPEAESVRHGRRVPDEGATEGHVRLMAGDALIAIGEARAQEVQPVVVFEPA
jgi:hypothetical protein